MNFSIILSQCKAFFYKIASISILYFNYLIKLSLVVVLNRGLLIYAIRTIRKKTIADNSTKYGYGCCE
jgi:hypothetical protein